MTQTRPHHSESLLVVATSHQSLYNHDYSPNFRPHYNTEGNHYSRLPKLLGLFWKRPLFFKGSFAKKISSLTEPTQHITTQFWLPIFQLQTLLHMARPSAKVTREMVCKEPNIDSKKQNLNRALCSQKSHIFHEGHYSLILCPLYAVRHESTMYREILFLLYIFAV